MNKKLLIRLKLLKEIEQLKKEIGFIGSLNEQCYTDDGLKGLVEELKRRNKNEKDNDTRIN